MHVGRLGDARLAAAENLFKRIFDTTNLAKESDLWMKPNAP